MLVHIGDYQAASLIENAWLATLEAGFHTADIYRQGHSKQKMSTMEFADAVIANLGKKPGQFKAVNYQAPEASQVTKQASSETLQEKTLVGTDIYIDLPICGPQEVADRLQDLSGKLSLQIITNRGVKVWPGGRAETYCSDHWRCRFLAGKDYPACSHEDIVNLLQQVIAKELDVIKTENLYKFDDELGFSLAQGE